MIEGQMLLKLSEKKSAKGFNGIQATVPSQKTPLPYRKMPIEHIE
jgi:hypothetical protein